MIEETEYWNTGIIYNLKQRWKHRGQKIIVELQMWTKYEHGHNVAMLDRRDFWTDQKKTDIEIDGYKRTTGLYDNIIYWGVPVYTIIKNGETMDISKFVDDTGKPIYSLDTASTLHDEMRSNATMDFMKGMGKTQLASMDLQKILMMGLLAIGGVIGLWVMGVF